MVRCDDCGAEAVAVWRHDVRTESMTHTRVRWLCRDCHGGVHSPVERTAPTERQVVSDARPGAHAD